VWSHQYATVEQGGVDQKSRCRMRSVLEQAKALPKQAYFSYRFPSCREKYEKLQSKQVAISKIYFSKQIFDRKTN